MGSGGVGAFHSPSTPNDRTCKSVLSKSTKPEIMLILLHAVELPDKSAHEHSLGTYAGKVSDPEGP
jgi:hypothetical protein